MKNKLFLISLIFLNTIIFAGAVSPVISLRFNDIVNSKDALPAPVTVIGLKMEVDEGVYSGFDSGGGNFRIFVQRSFGTLGLGRDADGNPQFTVGANYNALENLMVNMDYIVNTLSDDPDNPGTPNPDELRMSLTISF